MGATRAAPAHARDTGHHAPAVPRRVGLGKQGHPAGAPGARLGVHLAQLARQARTAADARLAHARLPHLRAPSAGNCWEHARRAASRQGHATARRRPRPAVNVL